jgi:hypothetical protein
MSLLEVLREETERLLTHLRLEGFWYGHKDRRRRHDATTWDINCGYCEDFADAVAAQVPGAEAVWAYDPELHPPMFDNDPESWLPDHCVVLYEGRYYDAECHEGVDRVRDLPIYKNAGKSRAQVIRERRAMRGVHKKCAVSTQEREHGNTSIQ